MCIYSHALCNQQSMESFEVLQQIWASVVGIITAQFKNNKYISGIIIFSGDIAAINDTYYRDNEVKQYLNICGNSHPAFLEQYNEKNMHVFDGYNSSFSIGLDESPFNIYCRIV